jgi:23S rRNA (pseudouridine1915-N3)-methyltransferase
MGQGEGEAMKWTITTVGRPGLEYAALGAAEYLGRLRRMGGIEWSACRALPVEKAPGEFWLVLDERGQLLTTEDFRRKVDRWDLAGCKRIRVLIGGAGGHDDRTREQADCLMALSPFTMQHELALVVFLEQLYRVFTLKRGEPYHR